MTLDPTLRDQLAKTIHDATCPCAHFPDRHPASRGGYLTAADKAAELLQSQPAPIVLPTVEEASEAVSIAAHQGGSYTDYAQAVLDLIASRVRHWVPVKPGTLIKTGTRVRFEFAPGGADEVVQTEDWTVSNSTNVTVYIDPATVPAEPTWSPDLLRKLEDAWEAAGGHGCMDPERLADALAERGIRLDGGAES